MSAKSDALEAAVTDYIEARTAIDATPGARPRALADRDYLTATLTQFRLDLDHGVEARLLVRSLW